MPTDDPNDYRIAWTPADEGYLSYSEENNSRHGNSYPAGDTTSLTLTGLPGGVTYKTMMRARYHDDQTNEDSSGPWTGEVTQRVLNDPPTAPTELAATETESKGETNVVLSWTAPSHDDLTGYRIWRSADANSLTELVQDTGNTQTSYSDTTTETGNTYVYAVTALSLDGDSPRSATVSITRGDGGGISQRDAPPENDGNIIIVPDDEEEELIALQQQGSNEVVLASTDTGELNTTGGGVELIKDATPFTTGDNEHGYVLTKVTHVIHIISAGTGVVGAALHADNAGDPGDEIPVTHTGEVLLEKNKKYWIVPTKKSGSTVDTYISYKKNIATPTAQPGWSLGPLSKYYHLGAWLSVRNIYATRLEGVVGTPPTDEPSDSDFPMDASTLGRLRVGTTSTGVLDATDDNLSGDLFKIEGLEPGHSYRVRAWFGTTKEDSATADRGGPLGYRQAIGEATKYPRSRPTTTTCSTTGGHHSCSPRSQAWNTTWTSSRRRSGPPKGYPQPIPTTAPTCWRSTTWE